MSVFRYAAVVLAVGSLAGVIYAVASGAGQSSVTAQRFVNLQEGAKPHARVRHQML
jgi:catalase